MQGKGKLRLRERTAASVATPPADECDIFLEGGTPGTVKVKKDNGSVIDLESEGLGNVFVSGRDVYGIVPGATDMTTNFQNALAGVALGACLVVDPGSYVISANLSVSRNISVWALGTSFTGGFTVDFTDGIILKGNPSVAHLMFGGSQTYPGLEHDFEFHGETAWKGAWRISNFTVVNSSSVLLNQTAIGASAIFGGDTTFTLSAMDQIQMKSGKMYFVKRRGAGLNRAIILPSGSNTIDGKARLVLGKDESAIIIASDSTSTGDWIRITQPERGALIHLGW